MKNFTSKGFYIFSVIILFVGATLPALAQFTNSVVESGGLYTALAKDAGNNLYVTRVTPSTAGATYEVEKYINGTGTPTVIYTGLTHELGDYPWGLAVTSTGNVYISTDFTTSTNGTIIELTFNSGAGTYTSSTFQTGRYFTALAVDAGDNLYDTEYDVTNTTYAVVKYAANSAANSAGTKLYDDLKTAAGYAYPTGLAVAGNGDVYVADAFSNTPSIIDGGHVYKLTAASSYAVSTVSTGMYSSALALDASGDLLSSENSGSGYQLVKYPSGGGATSVVFTPLHTNGIYYPWGIAVINTSDIFVADGDDETHGGEVIHLLSNNANLTNLAVSSGTLTPGFAAATTSYTAGVTSATTSVTVTPTSADPNATITVAVNGGAAAAVTSGTASGSLPLNVGSNTITVKVTAQDGVTIKTYTITVGRGSTNAFLSHIIMSGGTLTAAGATSFTASVPNATASVTVTPTTSDPNATVTVAVNGGTAAAVTSGTPSGSLPLNVGANTITTVVTAQNGVVTQTYIITVTRISNDAFLSHITISAGTLVASGATSFTASVGFATTSVTVTPTNLDPTATVTVAVNGGAAAAVTSGTASSSLPLNIGSNTITVKVTAQDGVTTKIYTITVTRVSNNAFLSHIIMSGGMLTASGATSFTASVPNTTTSVTVTPTTSDPNATVTVAVNGGTAAAVTSGTASGNLPLNVGSNTITTIVTAQDGVTTKTYIITVTRAPSTDAFLSHITMSGGTLTAAGATSFTATVGFATTSVTVTPTTLDPTATVTVAVNGGAAAAVTSGTASGSLPLNIGANTITTVVTAQDGITTKTYTITVTRVSNNAFLSHISMSGGSLTASGATSFTASVPNATTSVTVTPTTSDPNATVTVAVNGGAAAAVTSGTPSGSLALNVGSNTITTIVTAQDGVTTKTYIITVTRASGQLMSLYLPIQTVSVTKPADNVTIESDGILVHQGVSPNGDGINDVLTIDGITAYPNNNLTIVDRNGSLIFQAEGYDNSVKVFDGHSSINGKMQQPGTYFYSLDYTVNGQSRNKTGYIILKY